ncbi:3-hydroxyacyl-ACP dehydratase FabZ family protein [Actinomadura opuntiae]|uniref:3-hydroxyacyl-ACP dehydratase FabZ family protein n=1 Tax=Actinomadura sp. OS1-43 TaxID=604315 RepID=UPI00255AE2E9|nr:hypothetical protein [Actinomadura sp. OS1-43]MDL4820282.1 hypothetical protein [Actinomadura sp. OS1-43]
MTTAPAPTWRTAPAAPPVAAPARAVDAWRAEPIDGGWTVSARVRVRGDDPNLRGHFPGLAVYPGVFMVETLRQSVALAVPGDPALRLLRSVRFLSPLLDGDELHMRITATERPDGGWDVTGTGRNGADGRPVTRLSALFGSPPDASGGPLTSLPAGVREHPAVRATLPQRHPLLLVDRVVEFDPGIGVVAVKAVTANEPCYAGVPDGAGENAYHYPPSLIVESLGQAAALLWLDGDGTRDPADPAGPADPRSLGGDGAVLMFAGARDFSFDGAVRPGDVMVHRVRLDSVVAGTAFACGETRVGGRRVAAVRHLIATRRPVRPTDSAPVPGADAHDSDDARSSREGTR